MKTAKDWFEEELSEEPLTQDSVIECIRLVQEEEIEKAADDYAESFRYSSEITGWFKQKTKDFKAGASFVENKVQECVGDIIIKNQGLKLYKNNEAERFKILAIEFAEYVLRDKLLFSEDLFKQFLKERSNG
jgi:hypothetical protein